MTALLAAARAWIEQDCSPVDAAELAEILAHAAEGDTDALADLADRFRGPLTFGTAGLRGPLRAGPNGMNRAVVRRAAHGLAVHLDALGAVGPVVIGYDARHGSSLFAADSAAVITASGRAALLLPGPLPTPVLAFAVRHLGAAAGVMVTASHNPPQDNGYKVYLGDGAQIVPPADSQIAARIAAAPAPRDVPLGPEGTVLGDDVLEAYLDAVASLAASLSPDGPRDLRVAATALHGVGGLVLTAALTRAGFGRPSVVTEQSMPDPDFPTVDFPNPEEPGALDLVLALADAVDADLVIANDPDADRLALAARAADRTWTPLPGDRTGCVVAEYVLARTTGERSVATTVVSSTLLGRIAAAHPGVTAHRTLTGFKWLVQAPGRLVLAYEEALGVAAGDDAGLRVLDKDGIAAAVVACCLAAEAKAAGRTVWDLVDDLERRHGVHLTAGVSVRLPDPSAAVAAVVASPPATLGGVAVTSVTDLAAGLDGLPPTDGLLLLLETGVRVVVRPSGTEPKAKAYVEVVRAAADDVAGSRAQAQTLLDAVCADLRVLLG